MLLLRLLIMVLSASGCIFENFSDASGGPTYRIRNATTISVNVAVDVEGAPKGYWSRQLPPGGQAAGIVNSGPRRFRLTAEARDLNSKVVFCQFYSRDNVRDDIIEIVIEEGKLACPIPAR